MSNCLPLLAIASVAGGAWPETAQRALSNLYANEVEDSDTLMVALLADIQTVFAGRPTERLTTKELLGALHRMEHRPWNHSAHGKPLTGHALARMLRPFDVRSKQFGGPGNPRGYERESFEDAWLRYLPAGAEEQSATPLQSACDGRSCDSESAIDNSDVALPESEKPAPGPHRSTLALPSGAPGACAGSESMQANDAADEYSEYEERAAIAEYDGNVDRRFAEHLAGKTVGS